MDAQQRQQAIEVVPRNSSETGFVNNESETETVNQTVLEEIASIVNPQENADQSDTTTTLPPVEEPECCSICHTELTSVVAFGLLENCDHVYCANCILTWYQSQSEQGSNTKTCPYCRLESTRLIIWSETKIESADKKTAVFELQNRCFNLWSTPVAMPRQTPAPTAFPDDTEVQRLERRARLRDRAAQLMGVNRTTPRN